MAASLTLEERTSSLLMLGDPALRVESNDVSEELFGSERLRALALDMTDVLRAAGGLGLAAPQIGASLRVLLMEVADDRRYPGTPKMPLTCLINPIVVSLTSETEEAYEGCLSLPGLRGPVSRVTALRVDARDVEGAQVALRLSGAFARVLLHELDHLDGILYFDRIAPSDLPRFGFKDALEAAGIDLSLSRSAPAEWEPLSPPRTREAERS